MLKKVIIASESVFRRTFITSILSPHKDIEVLGSARNSYETLELINKHNPDVLVLDIEFKNTVWLESFSDIIKDFKFSTVVLTDVDPKMEDILKIPFILKTYDYVIKPKGIWKEELPKIKDIIINKILLVDIPRTHKIDSKVRLFDKNKFIRQSQEFRSQKKVEVVNKVEKEIDHPKLHDREEKFDIRSEKYFLDLSPISGVRINTKIIVIGASVGGPRTLRSILSEVPYNFPAPILVVQHLSHLFMRQFATSLKDICRVNVKIGMNFEQIRPRTIYISPGAKHMQVTVKNNKPCIRTFEGAPVNFCRPSVDVLFFSTARVYKRKALGILLTGMGRDGVAGLKAIKVNGGKTIAESEETSILYGMPKIAAETGVANLVIPNYKIIEEMNKFVL